MKIFLLKVKSGNSRSVIQSLYVRQVSHFVIATCHVLCSVAL